MAVEERYGKYYIRFQYKKKDISMATEATGKREAESIEHAVKNAIRKGVFDHLDPMSRDVCIRFFKNNKLQVPESLRAAPDGSEYETEYKKELTLGEAARIACADPETQAKSDEYKNRFKICLSHLIRILGMDTPISDIKVHEIKKYALDRLQEGVAPGTIKRERGALSKIFRILMENEKIDRNPVSLAKFKVGKSGQRHVYVSHRDFMRIIEALPDWYRPLALTAYYTGMRRKEIMNLTRSRLLLDRRLIRLAPNNTKEEDWKLVPVHKDLVPVLQEVLMSQVVGLDKVFLANGKPISRSGMTEVWSRTVRSVGLEELHFHDLRHTWKTNARRSGIDEEVRMKIMGHADRLGSVHENYGRISSQELLDAVDKMTFDHGETDIWVVKREPVQTPQSQAGSKPGLDASMSTSRPRKAAK